MQKRLGSLARSSLAGLAVGLTLVVGVVPRSQAEGLRLYVDLAKVNVAEHRLEVRASRDVNRITLRVTGESGAPLADEERELSLSAGTAIALSWAPSSDEPVLRIDIRAFSPDGSNYTATITPWSLSIPHEEVNFKTDSAQIGESERPKLEASFGKVSEALARHPEIRGVMLFIAGHTDTVGEAGYNLRLSRQRAQAIARWFRQRGLRIPIGFEGFGESALLVKTADEVDEPRNRRVDYILSVNEPTFKSSGAHPTWSRVP